MGIIIAKFRKKTSTFDILTKLENEITSIHDFQKRTEETQKRITKYVILVLVLYGILALLGSYYYLPNKSTNEQLYCIIFFLPCPVGIWFTKKVLIWYYNRKIKKNEKKLITLKDKKKKILENVKENEPYKIAKEILDKFEREPKRPVLSTPQIQRPTPIPSTVARIQDTELRQRKPPILSLTPKLANLSALNNTGTGSPFHTPVARPLPVNKSPLPYSIFPRDRSAWDKMMDYLVGDGPSNRYAMICQNCHGHNGMALKEEFEYLQFRCCYCNTFNPSRKKRLTVPKIKSSTVLSNSPSSSSHSENGSGSESDSEKQPLVEEPDEEKDSPGTLNTDVINEVSDKELPVEKMEVDQAEGPKVGDETKNDAESLVAEEENADK